MFVNHLHPLGVLCPFLPPALNCDSPCFLIRNLLHLIVILAFPLWRVDYDQHFMKLKKNPVLKNKIWLASWGIKAKTKHPTDEGKHKWRPRGEKWDLRKGSDLQWTTCFEMHLRKTNQGVGKGAGNWGSQSGSEHVGSPAEVIHGCAAMEQADFRFWLNLLAC